MANNVLLVDIGSTYTKVVAVDLDYPKILGTASAPTTAATNIREGLFEALKCLTEKTGTTSYAESYGSSSAAGGLKMVAIGLVPALTAKAGKMAALGAGAKVLKTFAYELAASEVDEIQQLEPDIILLCGGTDGGNKEVILRNAEHLAGLAGELSVVVAGNKAAAKEAAEILEASGKQVRLCENVMPQYNCLNVEPAQAAIRNLFLEKIVQAKGLSEVQRFIGNPLLPTPRAVLQGAELLARGTAHQAGLGDLLVVDVGGATTDVYSMAEGAPASGVVLRGLQEPYAKRTVEGDLGLSHSARSTLEAVGRKKIAALTQLSEEEVEENLLLLEKEFSVSFSKEKEAVRNCLTYFAVKLATERHAGKIETIYTPCGPSFIQTGKDLTGIKTIIGTGGPLIYSSDPASLLAAARRSQEAALKPEGGSLYLDRSYIFAGMGLLSQKYPEEALALLKGELEWLG